MVDVCHAVTFGELTPAQREFARRAHAVPGGHELTRHGVFFYRYEQWGTYRWLVASDGETLEAVTFRDAR